MSETSGAWLQEPQPAWYIGHIPQNSFLKVTTPARVNVQFLVGGKDILYDGQGLVTIGNVLQSFGGTDSFNDAEVVMRVAGQTQSASYSLARVFFKERFLKYLLVLRAENSLSCYQVPMISCLNSSLAKIRSISSYRKICPSGTISLKSVSKPEDYSKGQKKLWQSAIVSSVIKTFYVL